MLIRSRTVLHTAPELALDCPRTFMTPRVNKIGKEVARDTHS